MFLRASKSLGFKLQIIQYNRVLYGDIASKAASMLQVTQGPEPGHRVLKSRVQGLGLRVLDLGFQVSIWKCRASTQEVVGRAPR